MGRQPCCDKVGLKRGPWTAEEDKKLMTFILTNGHCCWRAVPKLAGLLRCGKSCRLRWTNYLRPDLKRGLLSDSEEQLVIDLHSKIGNRWSKIAAHLPGRTDNEIKNHWNTHIKKKLKKMGIDPVTHKPISPISAGENQQQQQQQQEQEVVVADQEYGKKEEIWRNEDNISFHEDQEEEGTAGGEESNFFSRRDGDRPCPIMPRNDAFFCTDEVPLMQPEEIAVLPTSTAAAPPPLISSSFSSSTCSTTSTTPSQLWDLVEELMSDFPTEVEVHWLESCLWGVMDDLGTTGSDLTCNANDIFGTQRSSSPSDPFALFPTRGDPISDKDYCSWKVPHF